MCQSGCCGWSVAKGYEEISPFNETIAASNDMEPFWNGNTFIAAIIYKMSFIMWTMNGMEIENGEWREANTIRRIDSPVIAQQYPFYLFNWVKNWWNSNHSRVVNSIQRAIPFNMHTIHKQNTSNYDWSTTIAVVVVAAFSQQIFGLTKHGCIIHFSSSILNRWNFIEMKTKPVKMRHKMHFHVRIFAHCNQNRSPITKVWD